MNAMDIAAKGDAGSARSRGPAKAAPLLGRKSVLVGLLTTGFVATQAGHASAATVKPTPIAATPTMYAQRWAPATAYTLGQQVITPNNDVAAATVAHTSSAAYATDTLKWSLSSSFVRSLPGSSVGISWTVDPRTIRSAIPMPTASTTYYMRVQGSIVGANRYRIWVGTASGNISIANYANTGTGTTARPTGAPRNPTGSVACPTSGTSTLTPTAGGTFNIADGDWIGLSCNNSTATLGCGMDGTFSAMFAGLCLSDAAFPCTTPTATPTGASKPFYVAAENSAAVTPPPVTPPPVIPPAAAALLNYQTGNFSQWDEQQLFRAAQQQIVTTPARAGYPYTARFEVASGDMTSGDTGRNRSEVADYTSGNPVNGQTMWWGWSMYLPAGFHVDSDAQSPVGNGWIALTQWHCSSNSGGGSSGLGTALTKGTSTPHTVFHATTSEWTDPQPIPLGVWNDFRIGILWSDTNAGHVTLKMNGRTIVDSNCRTLEPGQSAYFKQGVYRAQSNQVQVIYYTGTRRGLTEASVTL